MARRRIGPVFRAHLLYSAISSLRCAPNIPTQYNFTIQRELHNDMKLEVGYVGSQGHRLLATHDINY